MDAKKEAFGMDAKHIGIAVLAFLMVSTLAYAIDAYGVVSSATQVSAHAESGDSATVDDSINASTYCNGSGCGADAETTAGAKAGNGQSCGGIAGIACANGLECRLDGSYPDSGGVCVTKGDSERSRTCPTAAYPSCQNGTVAYNYDSNGCAAYACRPPSAGVNVSVSVSAQPQQASIYNSFQVSSTITYVSGPSGAQDKKTFKVVTSYSDRNVVLAASAKGSGRLFFKSAEDDVISRILRPIAAIISGQKQEKSEDKQEKQAKNEDKQEDSDPEDTSASASSGGAAIVDVEPSAESSSGQERVDYLSLSPGESATTAAYFTPSTAGTKAVRLAVYTQETSCPKSEKTGMPCRTDYKLVAQADARVSVIGTQPPQPPANDTNSTNNTGASGVISLHSGWNMVSVPVNANVSMQSLAQQCGSADYAWLLAQSGYTREDTLAPGYGYWVKSSSDCSYQVNAANGTGSLAGLQAGWNLVGSLGTEGPVSALAGNCSLVSGPWYYSGGQYGYSSSLQPGKAYWIKVQSACRLGLPGEEQPPAPPS